MEVCKEVVKVLPWCCRREYTGVMTTTGIAQQPKDRTRAARAATPVTVAATAVTVAAPVIVFAVAWATASVREDMGIANVALVLASVTAVAALASARAGLVTSIVAALSLNYFHTEPLRSLRITAGSDLVSVALLAALGLAISAITALRVRNARVLQRGVDADGARDQLRDALALGRSALQVWDISALAAAAQLALIDVRLEQAGRSSLPAISRQRWEPGDRAENHLLVVPETGAVVHLRAPNHDARLVLTPRAGQGPVTIDRRAAMVFADQVELALGREASPSLAR